MTSLEFEGLTNEEKRNFVMSQHPKVKVYRSVTEAEKQKYGMHHYAMSLDNGWKVCRANTPDEVKANFATLYK